MFRPRRLVLVVNDAAFFLSHRLPIALGAQAAGYDVHVATPEDSASPRIVAAGLTHHAIPLTRRGTGPKDELRTVAALIALYRRLAPDVVHHVTAKPILYGGLAARLTRVPAVVHAVSGLGHVFISDAPRARAIREGIRATYRVVTGHPNCAVIFQNEDDRRAFGAAIRTPHVVLIPGSGVDRSQFRATPLPEGPPLVVLPARMLWDKGVREFVEAARLVRARHPEARFALVGDTDDGNPAAIPTRQLRGWAADGSVEWWGHRADMPAVLAEASIVCLPSYREGLPKTLIEALAAGRPIVTTDVPGCRDVVTVGRDGLRVPARDAAGLAAALAELLADRPRLARMASAATASAERFAVERVVSRTLDVYAERLG